MVYKLIYIEDLNPGSIILDLKNNGFEITHLNPGSFEKLVTAISDKKFDGLLLDFRLTQGSENAIFDAPTIAQMERTKSANNGIHFPIFLISSESNISRFYEDFTSSDLFDLSMPKEIFQMNLEKYCNRLRDFILSYHQIREQNFDFSKILGISASKLSTLDYRFNEKISDPRLKANTYKISRLIYNTLIKSIGPLIGEDVLSARLGVKKESAGWANLKDVFANAKYSGIYSNSYNRWWSLEIEKICTLKLGISSLRRLNAKQRVTAFESAGFSNLDALEKLEFSDSSNFWTICKDLNYPIDPIDGLELIAKELIPWQEKEYISILAAMKTSEHIKIVKPSELERFHNFLKSAKHGFMG